MSTTMELMKQQLKALQANCNSMASNIDSILTLIDHGEQTPSVDSDVCLHPPECLQDARTMGFPHRYICVGCGEYMELADEQIQDINNREMN